MRLVTNLPWVKDVYSFLYSYSVYQNISYWWNFGFLSGICMSIQIVTGVFLAMHYVANIDYAFISVEHIMRDVDFGWLIRYAHANGASFFFICVYIHIFRGLYYNSYLQPRGVLWVLGVAILFLMIGIAFLGYVLPWGQMSFWAATVITNLASAIPIVGEDIVQWLWGGFCVDNATLNRFFSLHYVLPFVLAFLVLLHLIALHDYGSTNPLGVYSSDDKVPFGPYLWVKDFFSALIFFDIFFIFVFFYPNYLGHPDNYIPANPLVTPAHIVPEWYFLPFFTILRSIPNKLGGVTIMLSAIFILALLPFIISSDIKDANNVYIKNLLFWFFLNNCFLLGWIGGKPAEGVFITLGIFTTFCYFFYFFLLFALSMRNKLKFFN
jgi:quinol-cytochrome oxidoreductase complex cytochrome b subunit